MKYDEFAFFNQQLAAMLRDGIPLEGALRRLCDDMRRGALRDELQALEADLAKGTPMVDASGPKNFARISLSMPMIRKPSPAKRLTVSEPINPAEPVTTITFI